MALQNQYKLAFLVLAASLACFTSMQAQASGGGGADPTAPRLPPGGKGDVQQGKVLSARIVPATDGTFSSSLCTGASAHFSVSGQAEFFYSKSGWESQSYSTSSSGSIRISCNPNDINAQVLDAASGVSVGSVSNDGNGCLLQLDSGATPQAVKIEVEASLGSTNAPITQTARASVVLVCDPDNYWAMAQNGCTFFKQGYYGREVGSCGSFSEDFSDSCSPELSTKYLQFKQELDQFVVRIKNDECFGLPYDGTRY